MSYMQKDVYLQCPVYVDIPDLCQTLCVEWSVSVVHHLSGNSGINSASATYGYNNHLYLRNLSFIKSSFQELILHFKGFTYCWNTWNTQLLLSYSFTFEVAAVEYWLSSLLAEQEVQSSIPGLAATISEIGYLLLPSRDMAERLLKRRKSSKQPTNQPTIIHIWTT